jgi:thymidylate synthase
MFRLSPIRNAEEFKFLCVLQSILHKTTFKDNRTGTKTKSIFSPPELRFSLENNSLPLLTTRKLPLRHIFEELMWFIRGQTDVRILRNKNIHIWDDNSSIEFLTANGFYHIPEWNIGKSYGYQFRHAKIDQLYEAIQLINKNPTSRRIIINLWNVEDLMEMVLPPCLFCYQFHVEDGTLSCKATQRSSDISLAGGWNITTISLLTILIAKVCNLKPKEIIWSVGDAHIYENQITGVETQLSRCPRPFPRLHLLDKKEITQFEFTDLILEDYNPYPSIKLAMNA